MLIHRVTEEGVVMTPLSDATNAYDLCMDVARAIREEPKRYNQQTWIEQLLEDGPTDNLEYIPRKDFPACGTVACRAGWMVTLTELFTNPEDVRNTAKEILGVTDSYDRFQLEVGRLFASWSVPEEKFFNEDGEFDRAAYAEAGACGVEEFAEKWKERLLNTPIRRPETASGLVEG